MDEIVPRMQITNAENPSQPFPDIYKKSLETGVVPIELKRANVKCDTYLREGIKRITKYL